MKKSILLGLLVLVYMAGLLSAIDQVKMKTINDDPYRYRQDTVMVVGGVTQFGEDNTKYSKYYFLKGDFGGIIKVITAIDWPEVNERYEVRGIVVINDKDEVTIIEQYRKKLSAATQPQIIDTSSQGDEKPPKGDSDLIYYLIGAAALLLVAIVILAAVMTSNKKKEAYVTPITGPTGVDHELTNIPEPASVVEGSTIKMAAPPAGTLKLLPGRFEVVSGDDTIKELRFYKTKNQDESEITFGRGTGPHYSHIQLKPMTVSTKQAKLLFTNGQYTLINYSTINATVVDGNPLPKEGSVVLQDGSKIEMGEIVFIFHAN